MIKGEAVKNVFIDYDGSNHVTNDVMHLYQDPIGVLGVKSNRLHVWIDLAPLCCPVSANLFRMQVNNAENRTFVADAAGPSGRCSSMYCQKGATC